MQFLKVFTLKYYDWVLDISVNERTITLMSFAKIPGNVVPEDWARVTTTFKGKELKRRQVQAENNRNKGSTAF